MCKHQVLVTVSKALENLRWLRKVWCISSIAVQEKRKDIVKSLLAASHNVSYHEIASEESTCISLHARFDRTRPKMQRCHNNAFDSLTNVYHL